MKLWKGYFWFCTFQLIMSFRASYLSGMTAFDLITLAILAVGLVGLQGYVYKIDYFNPLFWQFFFAIFMVSSIHYWFDLWLVIPFESLSSFIAGVYITTCLIAIPQCVALYRYAFKRSQPVLTNQDKTVG